jgi:hypothetical protein
MKDFDQSQETVKFINYASKEIQCNIHYSII